MRPTLLAAPLLASTLSLAPIAALADAPVGIALEHQDWTIACDNTRTCRAAGYQPDEHDSTPVPVLLTRKAGAGQAVTAAWELPTLETELRRSP